MTPKFSRNAGTLGRRIGSEKREAGRPDMRGEMARTCVVADDEIRVLENAREFIPAQQSVRVGQLDAGDSLCKLLFIRTRCQYDFVPVRDQCRGELVVIGPAFLRMARRTAWDQHDIRFARAGLVEQF